MGTKFSPDVSVEDTDWGNYILVEEKDGYFDAVVASYWDLKMWYTTTMDSDIAANF